MWQTQKLIWFPNNIDHKQVSENFSRDEVKEWLKPENYYGLSDKLAEQSYERVQNYLKNITLPNDFQLNELGLPPARFLL